MDRTVCCYNILNRVLTQLPVDMIEIEVIYSYFIIFTYDTLDDTSRRDDVTIRLTILLFVNLCSDE